MSEPGVSSRRRFIAPEVVQTSSMDCGPAALKCLLEGFYIPVSYGRLREACQTDVDGTSVDTIEEVANLLGLVAEQEVLPLDHLFLADRDILPALVVVRGADGPTHFVVAWRRFGDWLQVMDPSVGRRWVRIDAFNDEIFRHETSVPQADWRAWAQSEEALSAMRARLEAIGASRRDATSFTDKAMADEFWFTFGALDACVRLVGLIASKGGVSRGREAMRLLRALLDDTLTNTANIFRFVPVEYWSVRPDPGAYDIYEARLLLRGAVLMRVKGRAKLAATRTADIAAREDLSPELKAALTEKAQNPLRLLWDSLRDDGLFAPLVLMGAIVIATAATVVEALLFRGLFDIGGLLNLPSQRLAATLGLVVFVALMLAFRIPIYSESLRIGRRFDSRLRMALLRKLPQLTDRYFLSRPISDMADRAHSIHVTRNVPSLGIQFIQSLCELFLTFGGIMLIAPASAPAAAALALFALIAPIFVQPMINERDLRVRNHAAALSGFYLDTLLGLVPVRTHRAERAVRHQHESLLVEWARSSRRLARASIFASALQLIGATALACWLIVSHFLSVKGVTGADLLLVFWTLKLPSIGGTLTALAHQYPMQRNVLLRLMEPLSAPEALPEGAREDAERPLLDSAPPIGLAIRDGVVIAAGRPILRDINLDVAPGEHVGIVGVSGAGKSSLIGVLLGWHRLAEGSLDIDGEALTPARLVSLRHETAWLDPAVHIWNKSLLYNLNYAAEDAEFSRTAEAIDSAHLRRVLSKLKDGLQTSLGEGGALLSGGEGQRVRLGRALAQRKTRLVLLDEPFRGIDREQRSLMLAQAREHFRGVTMLCVTHDVGETLGFDRVLVVEGGRIIEDGAPVELAGKPTRYRALLDAEESLRAETWAGAQWRRLRVEGGAVLEGAR